MKLILLMIIMSSSVSAFAQEIALKPGLYKVTTTIYVEGKVYDPLAQMKEQMAGMPEAVKEQMLKSMGGFNKPQEQCITKEELTYDNFVKSMEAQKDCKYTLTKKTAKEIKTSVVCKDGTKYNMTTKIPKPTHFLVDASGTIAGKTNSKFKSEGTWLKDKCVKKKIPGKKS